MVKSMSDKILTENDSLGINATASEAKAPTAESPLRERPRLIMGVDPGTFGAIALIDPGPHEREIRSNSKVELVDVWDMPTFSVNGVRKIEPYALAALIDGVARKVDFCVMEDVGSMPGNGVASMFTFGYVTGVAAGSVAAHNIPIHKVRPSVWKGVLAVPASKDGARQKASQLLPSGAHLWKKKREDGRAEAALLALFGVRLRAGK